jgi:hypothetical protein
MKKESYTFILPIGLAPSAIEKVLEELKTALNARQEHERIWKVKG